MHIPVSYTHLDVYKRQDYDTAQRVLGNVLVLNIIIGLAFTVLTLLFLDPILYFFGGSEATIGYALSLIHIYTELKVEVCVKTVADADAILAFYLSSKAECESAQEKIELKTETKK